MIPTIPLITLSKNRWEIFPHEVKVVYDQAMNKIS